jgi:hypothetical protein
MTQNLDDINVLDFVVSSLKHIENVLEVRIKYTREDLETMDLVVQHFKKTARVLAKKRDEIEERLKSDPLELWAQRFDVLHNQNNRTRTPAS